MRTPLKALAAALLALGTASAHAQSAEAQVLVGQIVSTAPGMAEIGREIAAGARACAAWVNLRGGVRGRPIGVVSADDGGDPDSLLPRAKELLAKRPIVALLTPMGRAAMASFLPWASREGLAIVGPHNAGALSTQAPTLSTTFLLRTHPSVEALRLSTQLQTIGLQRIAIVYSDDEVGRETLAAFEEALASVGSSAALVLPLRRGEAGVVTRSLADGSTQAVLLATTGRDTQVMMRALKDHAREGRKIPAYALSGALSAQELGALGAAGQGLVMSQVLPSPESSTATLAKNYRDAVREAGGAPTYPGLEGCVAVLTLAQAMKRNAETPTRASVLKALRSAGEIDLGGWSVDLADRQRPGSRFTDITLVGSDGKWVR